MRGGLCITCVVPRREKSKWHRFTQIDISENIGFIRRPPRYRDEWFVGVVLNTCFDISEEFFFGMVAMLRYLDSYLIVLDVPRAGS